MAVSFIALSFMLMAGCEIGQPTLWDQHCATCHEGKTVLNDQVAPDKQDIIHKYTNMEQFMLSSLTSLPCGNLLKHDEDIFRKVGLEIGIPE
jgi:hypothetical protein